MMHKKTYRPSYMFKAPNTQKSIERHNFREKVKLMKEEINPIVDELLKDKPLRPSLGLGELSIPIVIAGIMQGKKKKDIAVEAGSTSADDSKKAEQVNRILRKPEVQALLKPRMDKLNKEIDRIIVELTEKNLDTERHGQLTDSLEKLVKIERLLSNKSTENVAIGSQEVKEFLANS